MLPTLRLAIQLRDDGSAHLATALSPIDALMALTFDFPYKHFGWEIE